MARVQKIVQKLLLKMRKNEWDLGINIINGWENFKTLRKCTGYANSIQLSSGIRLKGGNGIPTARLIIISQMMTMIMIRKSMIKMSMGMMTTDRTSSTLNHILIQLDELMQYPIRYGYSIGWYARVSPPTSILPLLPLLFLPNRMRHGGAERVVNWKRRRGSQRWSWRQMRGFVNRRWGTCPLRLDLSSYTFFCYIAQNKYQ